MPRAGDRDISGALPAPAERCPQIALLVELMSEGAMHVPRVSRSGSTVVSVPHQCRRIGDDARWPSQLWARRRRPTGRVGSIQVPPGVRAGARAPSITRRGAGQKSTCSRRLTQARGTHHPRRPKARNHLDRRRRRPPPIKPADAGRFSGSPPPAGVIPSGCAFSFERRAAGQWRGCADSGGHAAQPHRQRRRPAGGAAAQLVISPARTACGRERQRACRDLGAGRFGNSTPRQGGDRGRRAAQSPSAQWSGNIGGGCPRQTAATASPSAPHWPDPATRKSMHGWPARARR